MAGVRERAATCRGMIVEHPARDRDRTCDVRLVSKGRVFPFTSRRSKRRDVGLWAGCPKTMRIAGCCGDPPVSPMDEVRGVVLRSSSGTM